MADEPTTEKVNTPASEMPAEQQHSEPTAEKVEISKAEFEKLQAALKDANKEAAARRKRLEELEAAETKRKEAEMTETEKVAKRAQELEAKVKAFERNELARKVAAKVGLPEVLASRLQGATEEELEADAKTLLDTLPKQKTTPPVGPTNPGSGASTAETMAQKKARLNPQNASGIWNPSEGGVIFKE